MSTSASLDINLYGKANGVFSSTQIIQALLNGGWNIINRDEVVYLPLGDEDFDWQNNSFSVEGFIDLVHEKEQAHEIIGVDLFWRDTEIGGTLLIFPNNSVSLSTTINRQMLQGNITDVNWYLEKMIPCFEANCIGVESFVFTQM